MLKESRQPRFFTCGYCRDSKIIRRPSNRPRMLSRLAIATLFCIAALGLPRYSPAQIPGRTGIGVKSGVTVSSFRPSLEGALGYRTSYLFGLYGQVPVTEVLTLQPEALFVRRRSRGPSSRFQYRLDYLQLPLLVKTSLPTGSQFRPHLHAGPYVGLAVRRKIIDRVGRGVYYKPKNDYFKPFEVGVSIGIGVEAILQDHVVMLSGRYDTGLTGASRENLFYLRGDPVILKSSVFTVALGVAI